LSFGGNEAAECRYRACQNGHAPSFFIRKKAEKVGEDMRKIKMMIGDVEICAELFDTPTADAIYEAAPFTSTVMTWGDEVYFSTPVSMPREPDARAVFEAGELAFWNDGDAIAIGYGPTPISHGDEIRLASPSNLWGRTPDDVTQLGSVPAGELITVEVAE
jgi:uncharacterized protein